MLTHDSSNVIDIEKIAKQTFSPRNFRYQNETNRLLSRFFKFEVERIVDPRNVCYRNEMSHLVPQIFRIEVEQTN